MRAWWRSCQQAIALAALATVGVAASPELPQRVPDNQLEDDPYRHVGLVRTDATGIDPTVLGSGWVAGERVVASAAHVFFVDETLGWNRNRWYWRRAAPRGTFWYTGEMISPRSRRVLAGYAYAVERAGNDGGASPDALNRDAIALTFYRSVTNVPPPVRRRDALAGSGTYSIIGYPAQLGDVELPEIEMHAHLGGRVATYERFGGPMDTHGHGNALFSTAGITSGPGGSGGPVFKRIGNDWTVVGTLLAGRENEYSIARALDAEFDDMLATAIGESSLLGPGDFLWEQVTSSESLPVMRRDGSTVLAAGLEAVRAIDVRGAELWSRDLPNLRIRWLAEASDGRILVGALYHVVALEGSTGREIWRCSLPHPLEDGAVGEAGEVYVSGGSRLARVSPSGELGWVATLPGSAAAGQRAAPVIGRDGSVFVLSGERLHAVDPNSGTLRWSSDSLVNVANDSLALAGDGSVTVASHETVWRFSSDGTPQWQFATAGNTATRLLVRDNGGVVLIRGNSNVLILRPDGTVERSFAAGARAVAVAEDASGNWYIGTDTHVVGFDAEGNERWRTGEARGRVLLSPHNHLLAAGGSPYAWRAIGTHAGVDRATWQPGIGGTDAARRVSTSEPVAPRLVSLPAPTRAILGHRLELAVVAEGSHPLTFEWRRNERILADQVGRRLIIREATAEDAGDYSVTVRNLAGAAVSEPVTVTVAEPRFGDQLWRTTWLTSAKPAIADDGTVYLVVLEEDPNDPYRQFQRLVALDPAGNEKWVRETSHQPSAARETPPLVGDDGRIYVGSHRRISAWTATGEKLWLHELTTDGSSDVPRLALARDNGVFYSTFDRIGYLGADGVRRWERTNSRATGLMVRRDGSLVIGPGEVISPAGVVQSSPVATDARFNFIGPADEWFVTTSDGSATYDRDGNLLARNPEAIHDEPLLLLSDGSVVTDRMRFEPFMGTGSRMLPPLGSGTAAAVLEDDRILWVGDFGRYVVVHKAGEILREADNLGGRNFTVGGAGILVGGSPVAAYHLDWAPAATAWPMGLADPRNTNRAPDEFVLRPLPPTAVRVRGRSDPSGEYRPSLPYREQSLSVPDGYSAQLSAAVSGSGPFTFRWQRNGEDLSFRGGELLLKKVTASDAGTYTVVVTNPAGTVYSESFVVTVTAPQSVSPGSYVRLWTNPLTQEQAPCLIIIGEDRQIEVNLFDSVGLQARGPIKPDGTFRVGNLARGLAGAINGNQITTTDGSTLADYDSRVAGHAPNGMPAGVYRGHSTGRAGFPVTVLVLNDGRFVWLQGMINGYSRSAGGRFSGGALTTTFVDSSNHAGVEYDVSGRDDGTIVGRAEPESGQTRDYTGFSALWTGRPEIERFANLSSRGYVDPQQPPMIVGFVVGGEGAHPVLLRAVGPGLAEHGITGFLGRPRLRLVDGHGAEIQQSLDWELNPDVEIVRAAMNRVGAFPLNRGSRDAALRAIVAPGNYTALVDAVDGRPGVALVETYEDAATGSNTARLRNLSTRGTVGQGERVLIGGFVITGRAPKSMLIRAVGPSLAQFAQGAFNVAANPRLRVYRAQESEALAMNESHWLGGNEAEIANAARKVGAFAFLPSANDAALVLALEPGNYTALVDNLADDEGVALLEIYEIPTQ